MVKEDPLHILSRTPTKASRNQEWAVWKEAEKNRTKEIKQWGVDTSTPIKSPVRRTTTPHKSPSTCRTTTTRTPKSSTPSCVVAASSQKKARVSNVNFKKSSTATPKKPPVAKAPSSSKKRPTKTTVDAKPAVKDMPPPKSTAEKVVEDNPDPAAPTVDVTHVTTSKIALPDNKKALELFMQMDENASGKLSLAELDKGVLILYPDFRNKPAVMAAYKACDTSNSGFIERKEFLYFLHYLVYYNNLWDLFAFIDDDGDRRITKDEFLDAADKLELERDAAEVFAEIDTNSGGMILFDELCHYMAKNKAEYGLDDANVEHVKQRLNDDVHKAKEKKVSNETKLNVEPVPVPEAVMTIVIPDKKEGMELFDRLDENASGKLSLAELDKGCVVLFPELNNKPAIMAAYKAADRSGNGFVERKEFGYFLRYIVYYNNLWSFFSSVDDDGDRRITKDEFLDAADKLELERDAAEVFAEIDTNSGGMILFDELCHYMSVNHSDWGADDANVEDVKQRLSDDAKEKKVGNETKPIVEPVPEAVVKIAIPDKKEGMELFDRLDENASGKLSLAEIDKGCVVLFPELNNKPAIMAAYKAADRSGNGFVERKEFGYFLRYIVYYNNLWSFFSSVDDDGDRRITKDEFLDAADKLELERDAAEVFAEIDTNSGGMILFDELCHYMSVNHSDWGADEQDVASVEAKLEGTS